MGNCFFIIGEGNFEVSIDGKYEKNLRKGDSFGEVALIYTSQRTASVKCISESTLFVVKSGLFRSMLKEVNTKSYKETKCLLDCVQVFAFLTNKQKSALSTAMVKNFFKKDEVLFQ